MLFTLHLTLSLSPSHRQVARTVLITTLHSATMFPCCHQKARPQVVHREALGPTPTNTCLRWVSGPVASADNLADTNCCSDTNTDSRHTQASTYSMDVAVFLSSIISIYLGILKQILFLNFLWYNTFCISVSLSFVPPWWYATLENSNINGRGDVCGDLCWARVLWGCGK